MLDIHNSQQSPDISELAHLYGAYHITQMFAKTRELASMNKHIACCTWLVMAV